MLVLLKLKVITELLEGDQISVIADGYFADCDGSTWRMDTLL